MWSLIIRYEAKKLGCSPLLLLALLVVLGCGVYAIGYGAAQHKREARLLAYIAARQDSIRQATIAAFSADTTTADGKALYGEMSYPSKIRFGYDFLAADPPSSLSALCLGLRDLHPGYVLLNAQSLCLQLFRAELGNPQKLLAGNFDLSFVLIYLLPLLIVALCYDLLSEDKALGVFRLLFTQTAHYKRIVVYRLSFYFLLIAALSLTLCVTAFVWTGVPVGSTQSLCWLAGVVFYETFWFALVLLVISFNRPSSFNALTLAGGWLLFTLLWPALVNTYAGIRHSAAPLPLTATIRRKNMESSEAAMQSALSAFYPRYPGYPRSTGSADPFYPFKAYSAFLSNADAQDRNVVARYDGQIGLRQQTQRAWNRVDPAAVLQELMSSLAATDLAHFMQYRRDAIRFHEKVFRFSNGPLFQDRRMRPDDFRTQPEFISSGENSGRNYAALRTLALLAGTCLLFSFYTIKRVRWS